MADPSEYFHGWIFYITNVFIPQKLPNVWYLYVHSNYRSKAIVKLRKDYLCVHSKYKSIVILKLRKDYLYVHSKYRSDAIPFTYWKGLSLCIQ